MDIAGLLTKLIMADHRLADWLEAGPWLGIDCYTWVVLTGWSASLEMGGYGWLSIDVSGQVDIAVYNWYDFPWLAMDSPDWLPMHD